MGVSARCNKSTGDVREANAWRQLSSEHELDEARKRPLLKSTTTSTTKDDEFKRDNRDRSKMWQSCKLLASKKIGFNINDDENLCYIWPTANNNDNDNDDEDYVECQRNRTTTGRSIDLQAPLALSSPTLCNSRGVGQRAKQRRRARRPMCKMAAGVDRSQQRRRRKRHIGVESPRPSISSSASVTSDSDAEQAGNCFARKLTHTHAPGNSTATSLTLHNNGHDGTIDDELRGLDVAQQLRNVNRCTSGCHQNEQQFNGFGDGSSATRFAAASAAASPEITNERYAEILIDRQQQVEQVNNNVNNSSTTLINMGIGARLAESSCALVESLARSCASSSSGSYKVAQVSGANNSNSTTRPEVKVKPSSAWAAAARPGRSPSSLQRQTNARLARHRAKIQAQRHEQLANLALRERQAEMRTAGHSSQRQQQSTSAISSPSASQQFAEVIEVLPLEEQQQQQQLDDFTQSSSSRLDNFITQLLNWRQSKRSTQSSNAFSHDDYSIITITNQEPAAAQQQERQLAADRLLELALPTTSSTIRRSTRINQDLERANVIVYRSPSEIQQRQSPHTSGAPQRQPVPLKSSVWTGGGGCFSGTSDDAMSVNSSNCSSSSSTLSLAYGKPFCKICHLSSSKHGDKLISPCKCSGTMQYIHCGCLLKWLEISNRTNEKQPMACELCAHEYTWHKRFNFQQMKLPKCSKRDIILHLTFILALGVMMFCALAPMFKQTTQLGGDTQAAKFAAASSSSSSQPSGVTFGDQDLPSRPPPVSTGRRYLKNGGAANHLNGLAAGNPSSSSFNSSSGRLASDEKFILFCAASFFISFFVAIYAQTKARDTLYGLMVKFANMNLTYYITEYDHGCNSAAGAATTKSTTTNDYDQATSTLIDTRKSSSSSSSSGAR